MKLAVGDDFKPIYLLFRRIQQRFPQHIGSISKLKKSVDSHINRYNNCLWLHGRTGKERYLSDAQKELDSICELLTVVEKQELMGILSGEVQR